MPASRLLSAASTNVSSRFSRALLFALVASTCACDIVLDPDTDAAPDYTPVPEAGSGDAAMQDDAATTADAAVPPMQTDAGAVDGGVRDSGAALDAQAQVDAALADANDYDADAGSHDADAST